MSIPFLNDFCTKISAVLLTLHAITASTRIVKRVLKARGCLRRNAATREVYEAAVRFTLEQLECSGQCLGHRALWKRLQANHVNISQAKTLQLLRILDADGVAMRKKRRLHRRKYRNPGPDFAWHIDGYDKLKPYGFPMHGGIDGFSRRILWLEVGSTNNNPIQIAKYFVNTAISLGSLPCIVRADRGTENVHVRTIQVHFRSLHDDPLSGENSFQYGKSTGNQRIESFWGQLRKQCIQFWMNKFKDLVSSGALDMSSKVEAMTLRFCFLHLIRRDIKRMASEWNCHNIQRRRGQDFQGGKPDLLYFSPNYYHAAHYRKEFEEGDMHLVLDKLDSIQEFDDHNADFIRFLSHLLGNISVPNDLAEADDLYSDIISKVREMRPSV